MARLSFTADFDWRPTRRYLTAFKAGHEVTVTRACAEAAIAAGVAVEIAPPSSASAPANAVRYGALKLLPPDPLSASPPDPDSPPSPSVGGAESPPEQGT